ncbi:MAG: methionyl-tRNA formyltransferase, partial [Chthoniobacterales bacterium]|nr:methionyl-tRNA formyltransferase [Chthoniobacterales bacterium]
MRTVFLGSGDIGLPALRLLLAMPGIEVVGVVTQPDRPAGRGLQHTPCAIKELALAQGIVPLQPARVRSDEAVEEIKSWTPDLFVVMAYGQILPQTLLDVPLLGALNLHASLLPRHRGAAPVHAAVLAGDEKSGVTVMW